MRTDVVYATTDEGVKLAVIDVTNPAFTVSATDEELAAMAEQYILEAAQHGDSGGASGGVAELEAGAGADGGIGDFFGWDEYVSVEVGSGEFGGRLQSDRPKDRSVVSGVYGEASFAGYGAIACGWPGDDGCR